MNSAHITALVTLVWLMTCRCIAGETATAVATVTAGYVTAITVTFGGYGYSSEPGVTVNGGGGAGATARAILNGDKVAQIVVLTAGTGYNTSPTVTIEAPPKPLGLDVELVPKLTARGPTGGMLRIEWSVSLNGPWTIWTNVGVGVEGAVLVDLTPGATGRFYRAVERPLGPAGFVWVEPGTFVMGSPETEQGRWSDETQHTVTLSKGYWLSDHEVTQAEYQTVMGRNPSVRNDPDLPVENVNWGDAVMYCERLTELERAAGRITAQDAYRLPTEAEWEYAARAGTTGARYGELDAISWHGGTGGPAPPPANSGGKTWPAKGKQPNAWGLYDMLGNVWEWCSDWYGEYPSGAVRDPAGASSGPGHVTRGGSSFDFHTDARAANRSVWWPALPGLVPLNIGFRVVLSSIR